MKKVKAFLLSLGVAGVMSAAILAVAAAVIAKSGNLPQGPALTVLVTATACIGVFLGGLSAALFSGEKGALLQERIGYAKKAWKTVTVSSESGAHKAALAFDANPNTYWLSEADKEPHSLAIDLGKAQTLKGFAYTPQKESDKGMMAKGKIEISNDGKQWQTVESFEFGNLINDPSKRYHYFKQTVNARYVKITATEITANTGVAAIAEIDLF